MTKFITPVLIVTFNRPDVTSVLIDRLREVKPSHLYVSSDGPRESKGVHEKELVKQVRDLIEHIDWDCEVHKFYSEKNFGCGVGVSNAITWFFQNVEQGIILEDDCIPHKSFFGYCQELLDKYKDDHRVTHINGNNYGCTDCVDTNWDYHFTMYPQVWGWATWRRAWANFNYRTDLDGIRSEFETFKHMNWSKSDFELQKRKWKKAGNQVDIWDYQWHYINQLNGNLAITPKVNLVTNIGELGTHYNQADNSPLNIESSEMKLPISHPDFFFRDYRMEQFMKKFMIKNKLTTRIKRSLKSLLPG